MKKADLKNGMIVKSSGDRYGVVCLQDGTDKNCIKFFYAPTLLIEHGSVEKACYGSFIVSLEEFNESLQVMFPVDQLDSKVENLKREYLRNGISELVAWEITEVYSLSLEWRKQCDTNEN